MRRFGKIAIVACVSIATLGCVAFYKEPTTGPRAYVKLTDNLPVGWLTKTSPVVVFLYEDGDCSRRVRTNKDAWIEIPANRPMGFSHSYMVSGFLQGMCQVSTQLTLSEGQRVELAFEGRIEGMKVFCEVTGREHSSTGQIVGRVPLRAPPGQQCRMTY